MPCKNSTNLVEKLARKNSTNLVEKLNGKNCTKLVQNCHYHSPLCRGDIMWKLSIGAGQ